MDLLFESGMYQETLTVLEKVEEKRINGIRFPTDCVTIAMAACLKLVSIIGKEGTSH